MAMHRSTIALALSALVASLSTTAVAQSAPPAQPADGAAAPAAAVPVKWQGMLRATQQRTEMAYPTGQNKTTGTIRLTETAPERMRVQLSLSTTLNNAESLQWAVVPGRCGSNMMPIVALSRFPVIEVGPNGRADVNLEIALAMPATGNFHVNVYRGGQSLQSVLSCGNLTPAK